MVPKIRNETSREKDFKRQHGIAIRPKIRVQRKCFVCKKETNKYLGIRGKYDKEWDYCPEHYRAAKADRDSFLVKNKHKVYDKVPYHEEIAEEYKRGKIV